MVENIFISTDKKLLNIELIHNFLKCSYWAKEIPLMTVKRSIENSLCFGSYEDENQIGFGRVITDYSTFAYLSDVFIVSEKQGRGHGKQLIKYILEYPKLAGLKRWHLVTLDAQDLYKKFGFDNPDELEHHMEIKNLNIYKETSIKNKK